jgi:hypothetical protein
LNTESVGRGLLCGGGEDIFEHRVNSLQHDWPRKGLLTWFGETQNKFKQRSEISTHPEEYYRTNDAGTAVPARAQNPCNESRSRTHQDGSCEPVFFFSTKFPNMNMSFEKQNRIVKWKYRKVSFVLLEMAKLER